MPEINKESANKPKRLGRGLGSLFGEGNSGPAGSAVGEADKIGHSQQQQQQPARQAEQKPEPNLPPDQRIWTVAIDKLKPSPFQPRTQFEKGALEELAQSIRSSGILQPIIVRKTSAHGFEIVAGERRWRAAQLAGLHEVPVILKVFDDRQTLELALIENLQRQDLNPIEEAEAYQRLSQDFNLTQAEIAQKVGKERATVANALRLLQLPDEVREMVTQQLITVGHAKVLLSLESPKLQKEWARKIVKTGLPVRGLETLIKKKSEALENDSPSLDQSEGKLIQGVSDELQKALGTKVNIEYSAGKGKLSIQFYSAEQFNNLIDRIREACQK